MAVNELLLDADTRVLKHTQGHAYRSSLIKVRIRKHPNKRYKVFLLSVVYRSALNTNKPLLKPLFNVLSLISQTLLISSPLYCCIDYS